jgi:3-mercaptopyruvate sulfurtransferase SseA
MKDAVFFDWDAFWNDQDGTDKELDLDKLTNYLKNLKLGKELNVLCYDRIDGVAACMVAVYLRIYGFNRVAVLNERF